MLTYKLSYCWCENGQEKGRGLQYLHQSSDKKARKEAKKFISRLRTASGPHLEYSNLSLTLIERGIPVREIEL